MAITIFTSSAGSGKTFTMVSRFLIRVIDKPWSFSRILIVTFTNKATEELKTRIIRELDHISSGKMTPVLDVIKNNLKGFSEEEIRLRAGEVLVRILHDYSSFSVSTIDSFFQGLTRALARELDIPMQFEIELDTESICEQVTDMLLDESGQNEDVRKWLQDLLIHGLDENGNWNLRKPLLQMTRQLLSNPEAMEISNRQSDHIRSLITWMKEYRGRVETFMRSKAREALRSMQQHGYAVSSFYYKESGPAGYFAKVSRNTSTYKDFVADKARLQAAYNDPLSFLSKSDRNDASKVEFVSTLLHPILEEMLDFYNDEKRNYLTIISALKLIYQAGISSALEQKLRDFRSDNHLFHLSDTTRLLSRAVLDQDAPFIYEKAGNTYSHIFIDEFQDTSTLQWDILRPLVINALSTNQEVLIVGDAKQSIYRWRGGNMNLILEGVEKDLAPFNYTLKKKNLDTNYRSWPGIVEFNNILFPALADYFSMLIPEGKTHFEQAYTGSNLQQHSGNKSGERGYLEFRFFNTPEPADDQEGPAHWKEAALSQLHKQLDELMQSGYEPGDIAILVRTGQHESEIAEALLQKGKFRFVSSGSLLLSAQPEINLLLNCMRFVCGDNSLLLLAEINDFFRIINKGEQIPYGMALPQYQSDSWTKNKLEPISYELRLLPLTLLYHRLCAICELDRLNPFLCRFTGVIEEYIRKEGESVKGFTQWWEKNKESKQWSLELPESRDAIRIITIHKSKGLEFPVVMMPFFDWKFYPKPTQVLWAHCNQQEFRAAGKLPVYTTELLNETWYDEAYKREKLDTVFDNINLIYVALTRPIEQLYLYTSYGSKEGHSGLALLSALQQMPCWEQHRDEPESTVVEIGSRPGKRKSGKRAQDASLYNPEAIQARWIDPINESRLTLELKKEFHSTETLMGELIHDLLSKIDESPDTEALIRKACFTASFYPNEKQLEGIRSTLKEAQLLLEKKGWSSQYYIHLNERAITTQKGVVLRPDKVLIGQKDLIVLDFKTGKKSDTYQSQLNAYAEALSEIYSLPVSAWILYTREMQLVKVDTDGTSVTG
jgi:ATP-dependent exoDNAse (exonuclease V) beta subunit